MLCELAPLTFKDVIDVQDVRVFFLIIDVVVVGGDFFKDHIVDKLIRNLFQNLIDYFNLRHVFKFLKVDKLDYISRSRSSILITEHIWIGI